MAKKKLFGGYSIKFKGVKESLEDVFGSAALAPSEMTKRLWAFVKKKRLDGKSLDFIWMFFIFLF